MKEFISSSAEEKYVKAFSSANWETLPAAEKSHYSLSNCVPCATQLEQLQKVFPLKPFFCLLPIEEKEYASYRN